MNRSLLRLGRSDMPTPERPSHPAGRRSVGRSEETVLGSTKSICPQCGQLLEAELRNRDGKVVLARSCADHGEYAAVVYGDAARYLEIQRFSRPGETPQERQTVVTHGCPHDCGICPEHAQH